MASELTWPARRGPGEILVPTSLVEAGRHVAMTENVDSKLSGGGHRAIPARNARRRAKPPRLCSNLDGAVSKMQGLASTLWVSSAQSTITSSTTRQPRAPTERSTIARHPVTLGRVQRLNTTRSHGPLQAEEQEIHQTRGFGISPEPDPCLLCAGQGAAAR